jgi:hypothetical protein
MLAYNPAQLIVSPFILDKLTPSLIDGTLKTVT